MKPLSQRRTFVILMTMFATPFVIAISRLKFGRQADLITDSLKIGVLVAVSTIAISFCVWTGMQGKKRSILRGGLAGLVSALLIVPIPSAVWTFKAQTLEAVQTGSNLIEAFFPSVPIAVTAGLYTFVDITKASLVAISASAVLGMAIAYYLPDRPKD